MTVDVVQGAGGHSAVFDEAYVPPTSAPAPTQEPR
jgi:hypothetical protein